MANNRSVLIASLASPESDLRRAKQEWSRRLLQTPAAMAFRATAAVSPAPEENVVGVGIGEKYAGDEPTGILGLKFFVVRKYPEGQLSEREKLPRDVDGLPVDVEQVGVIRRHKTAKPKAQATIPNPRVKIRPAQPGCSVGFISTAFRMAGTFGAVVSDGTYQFVLSNNHVLADENRLPLGSPIVQPGTLDGGTSADTIAHLTRFIPLSPTGNQVDCAIAQVQTPGDVSPDVLHIGTPKGVGDAAIDMVVQKFGRTTSYTVGRVSSVDTDVKVQYETGLYQFDDQIIIRGLDGKAFSAGGDSGSLILERGSNLSVGLLFAGSSTHTIANHLSAVLSALQVTLVP
ncbi:MAG TPA: hypothetical protein VJT67_08365 [Longimicrobiaceae bacterium]|nr:hypothetical protein [Longimicrobiaceae bacterium]